MQPRLTLTSMARATGRFTAVLSRFITLRAANRIRPRSHALHGGAATSGGVARRPLRDGLGIIAAVALLCIGATVPRTADAQYTTSTIVLPNNDIVYDPGTRLLYVSVPSAAGKPYGNTIVRIDPELAAIVDSVFVGSEPSRLARSDNGEFIYVGLSGAAAIRRYEIANHLAGLQFSLGTGFFGPSFAEDIEVLPGQPGVIAVSLRRIGISPRHDGVAIFDNGVRRPVMTPDHTGSNVLAHTNDPTLLYGFNNETTEFGLRRMAVSAQGVSVTSVVLSGIAGFNADIVYADGVIYATNGAAVSTATNTLIGFYQASGPVVARGRETYFASAFFSSIPQLRVFNRATFVLKFAIDLPECPLAPKRIVTVENSRLAVACGDRIVILDSGVLFADEFEELR